MQYRYRAKLHRRAFQPFVDMQANTATFTFVLVMRCLSDNRRYALMLTAGRSAADVARLFRVHRATISRIASAARR